MTRLNRFMLPLAGFLLVAVIFAISLMRAPPDGNRVIQSALLGSPAPDFALPDVVDAGRTVTMAEFRGGWTLMNVWGTWCPECRIEHPVLLDIQREGKVRIVGLDYKDDDNAALDWLRQLGNPYAAVPADREGRVAIDYGVYGAPETFLIDPQGVIRHKHVGAVTAEVWKRDFVPVMEGAP